MDSEHVTHKCCLREFSIKLMKNVSNEIMPSLVDIFLNMWEGRVMIFPPMSNLS